jgi:penicillin-binding protein 2
MYKRTPIKNYQHEIQLVNQRSVVAFVVMIILIVFLVARLTYLQWSQHTLYTTLSQKNSLDLIPVEPTRGLIYDRNGILLAENIPVFSLDVIPYLAGNLPKALSGIAKILPLSDTDIMLFQRQLKQHRRFDEIPLKMRLSEVDVAKFSENIYRFPGFLIKARLIRHYPFDASLSHVLGYVGRINIDELDDIDTTNYSATNYIGKLGIEKYYEDELHGTVGYQHVENDASGEPIRVLSQTNPVPGENLYLTLDSRLQIAVEKALEGQRGAVVAIQPSSGQVLAMISQPGYDPNLFVAGISNEEFRKLQESNNRPLYDRALRGLYPPASTIKLFLAFEGLQSGTITTNFSIFDPGYFQLKKSKHFFHDWRRHGHGTVNLYRAIVSSCDTYFYDLASKLGIERMDHILSQFGFGELSGIDLDGELPGVVASPNWKRRVKGIPWYEGDTVMSGIGQGYMQSTPLQLASAVATIASRGKRYTPYLLLGTQQPDKRFLRQAPTLTTQVDITEASYWNNVINAMQGVVSSKEGTGFRLKNTAYTIAAKTGTAQVYSFSKKHYETEGGEESDANIPEKLRDHHLLIAFAPVENPQIAIAVVVENSNKATTIAREILDYYLVQQPKTMPLPIQTALPKTNLQKKSTDNKGKVDVIG